MTYKIGITKAATADIGRIVKYVKSKFGNAKGLEIFNFLYVEINKLGDDPEKAYKIDELEELGITKFRRLVLPPHNKIIYEVNHRKKTIKVRVVYRTHQDFATVLKNRILRYFTVY